MFIDQHCYKVSLYEDERIYLQRSRCKFIKIISPRATLIKENSLHLHITHIYIYSTKFLRQHSIHRSNSFKMYKYFCQIDVSSIESQCKFAPRQSYHFLSNLPPHTQTRSKIWGWYFAYQPPLPPSPARLLRASKWVRTCYIAIYARTGRLRVIYTRLSLRSCFFSRLCYAMQDPPSGSPSSSRR